VADNKDILLRSRPWVKSQEEDEKDAAKTTENDPALARFHQQQQEFNARVHDELAGIPVPNGLRDQILARKTIVRVPTSSWSAKPLLALAAALVLLGVGFFYWTRPQEDLSVAGFRYRMVKFVLKEYSMEHVTKDMTDLKSYLSSKGRPNQFVLPPELAKVPLKGGQAMDWQGKPVSMVCFDWNGKETLFMFVLDEALANGATPQIAPVKKLTTATWSADGKTFILAGEIPEKDLANLVKS